MLRLILLLCILVFIPPCESRAQCTEDDPCPEVARLSPTFIGGGVPAEAPAGLAYANEFGTGMSASEGSTFTITGMAYSTGNLVVISIAHNYDTSYTITGISDGTRNWTAGTNHNTEGMVIQNWWLIVPASVNETNATITITLSGEPGLGFGATAAVFTGSFNASPVDKDIKDPDSLSGESTSATLTTDTAFSQASEVLFLTCHDYDAASNSCTPDNDPEFTEISDFDAEIRVCTSYRIISATDALTIVTTFATSDYTLCTLISFKEQ